MAGRYTGTLPAYSIMSTGLGGGNTSRLDLATEEYRKEREEQEKLMQEEALRQRLATTDGRISESARNQAEAFLAQREENRSAALMSQGDGSFGRSPNAPMSTVIPREQRAMHHPGFDKYGYTGAAPESGTFSPSLLADLRKGPGKPEEDEFGFLDAMFLANLVAGREGGPAPTPYGTAVGGGNKTWASLPTLMRMS
tara:strand:- start:1407 stop:1997 length:591 start_codon:yes stop_codon:yes gene_type:complete